MSRVVHFEIQASQPQVLVEFYSQLFGWSFNKWGGPAEYWLIEKGPSENQELMAAFCRGEGRLPLLTCSRSTALSVR